MHKKVGVRTVFARTGERRVEALKTINAFIAELTFIDVQIIEAIPRLPDNMTVVAIFIANITSNQIAISALEGEITVISIFTTYVVDAHAWDGLMESVNLLKQRPVEIEFTSIIQRIPFVAPPFLYPIDGKGGCRSVHRENFFTTQCTCGVMEMEEITERNSLLSAAFRASHRRGDQLFPTIKDWRNLLIKSEVIVCHLKGLAAPRVCADFLHIGMVTRRSVTRHGRQGRLVDRES